MITGTYLISWLIINIKLNANYYRFIVTKISHTDIVSMNFVHVIDFPGNIHFMWDVSNNIGNCTNIFITLGLHDLFL